MTSSEGDMDSNKLRNSTCSDQFVQRFDCGSFSTIVKIEATQTSIMFLHVLNFEPDFILPFSGIRCKERVEKLQHAYLWPMGKCDLLRKTPLKETECSWDSSSSVKMASGLHRKEKKNEQIRRSSQSSKCI